MAEAASKVPPQKVSSIESIDKNKDGGLTLKKFTSLMTKLNKGQNNELSEKVNKKRMYLGTSQIANLKKGCNHGS